MKKQNNDDVVRFLNKIANELNISKDLWNNIEDINFSITTKSDTKSTGEYNMINLYIQKGADLKYHTYEYKDARTIRKR
jgi:pyruvate formate-lyase activating enzyme-like uncharacterized protein